MLLRFSFQAGVGLGRIYLSTPIVEAAKSITTRCQYEMYKEKKNIKRKKNGEVKKSFSAEGEDEGED